MHEFSCLNMKIHCTPNFVLYYNVHIISYLWIWHLINTLVFGHKACVYVMASQLFFIWYTVEKKRLLWWFRIQVCSVLLLCGSFRKAKMSQSAIRSFFFVVLPFNLYSLPLPPFCFSMIIATINISVQMMLFFLCLTWSKFDFTYIQTLDFNTV